MKTALIVGASRGIGFALVEEYLILLLAPGWVRTALGGPNARLGIEDSIPALVKTVAAQTGRPGLQSLDYLGEAVPW